ncbi:MAG: metallophosphoesterase [Acidobacteria bacterium]|nr:metallophosphoesterase [Acidobacteriota bacterium]
MNRRHFLRAAGLASAGCLGSLVVPTRRRILSAPQKGSWSFIHYTDVHVQPELRAEEGYRQAVNAMNAVKPKPQLAIAGGDLVFDAFETGYERADQLFKMYSRVTAGIDMPVHTVIGNHDLFGVSPKAGVPVTHPEFGKKMFTNRIGQGKTYRSFDFRDWHFVILDSIFVTPASAFEGRIDDEQFAWLQQDFRAVGSKRPVVLVTHIPFFSIFPALRNGSTQPVSSSLVMANSKQVLDFCADYNIKLLLQGHLHVVEDHRYKGSQYITSGAVCGNWWKGARMGHPEGFAVYTIQGDQIEWSYRTYGWQAATA